MYITTTKNGFSLGLNPSAFITKGKQRIKQFGNQVYLNDGETFQIELFNPHSSKILAKIKLNGKYISGGGIVLRPGERVFLERYLDENKSFIFKTYEVNGNNETVQRAIAANGLVEIEFHNEYHTSTISVSNGPTYWAYNNTVGQGWCGSGTIHRPSYTTTSNGVFNINYTDAINPVVSTDVGRLMANSSQTPKPLAKKAKLETGTVEKGSATSQTLVSSNDTFVVYPFHTVTWHILPNSVKPFTKEELNVAYCGECGTKRKKTTHKFCPQCGTKF